MMRLSKTSWLLVILILILGATVLTPPAQAQNTSADQYVASGQQLLNARNYTQAAQYFYAAVKLDPNNAAAYEGLGNCYYMGGRKSDALTFYQRALALQPSNTQLAQFVQNLQAQLNSGAGAPSAMETTDPLSVGESLFQQRQYAASIPYFLRAAEQNSSDYRPFYYAGYAYYMTGNRRFAALYFAVANMKQPNASIQAYADQVRNSLSPEDQQWVDNQLSEYSASTGLHYTPPGSRVEFGFNFLGGSTYIFSDPTQIINGAENSGAISISGTTPNLLAEVGVEPYVEFGHSFEIDFGVSYVPISNLAYTWLSPYQQISDGNGNLLYSNGSAVYGYQNTFENSLVLANLGLKVKFGDPTANPYLGLGMDIAPVSTTFGKLPTDQNGALISGGMEDPSSGTYNTVAFGGYAQAGIDFGLSKNLSLGPYVGVQILTATNFQRGTNTLVVNQNNGDVGVAGVGSLAGVANTTPLTLDYSNVNFGLNLSLSF